MGSGNLAVDHWYGDPENGA